MAGVGRTWPDHVDEIQAGDLVKVCLIGIDAVGEGIWVSVEEVCAPWGVLGALANEPFHTYDPPLAAGDLVAVNLFQIVDWSRDPSSPPKES